MNKRETEGVKRALATVRMVLRWQRLCDAGELPTHLPKGSTSGTTFAIEETEAWLLALLGKRSRLSARYRTMTLGAMDRHERLMRASLRRQRVPAKSRDALRGRSRWTTPYGSRTSE